MGGLGLVVAVGGGVPPSYGVSFGPLMVPFQRFMSSPMGLALTPALSESFDSSAASLLTRFKKLRVVS